MTEETCPQWQVAFDPVAMNVVNRIAAGTIQVGSIRCSGGLVVEGRIEGSVEVVGGPLWLLASGEIQGKVTVEGDAYLMGPIHSAPDGTLSEVYARGVAYLCETLQAKANVTAQALQTFHGMLVYGKLRTFKQMQDEAAQASNAACAKPSAAPVPDAARASAPHQRVRELA